MFNTPYIIPVVAIICWAVVSIIRARHGYPDPGWRDKAENMHVPPMFDKLLARAMETRDAEIKALKARIEVLEKIVIDTHKSTRLADEIDKLRNQ